MQLFVEVVGYRRDVLVLADKDSDVIQCHALFQQLLYFFSQGEKGLLRVVVLIVRFKESGFDVAAFLAFGRFLYHIGISSFQGLAILFQLVQMQRIEVVYGSGKHLIVETDDVRFATPVGFQGLHTDGEILQLRIENSRFFIS